MKKLVSGFLALAAIGIFPVAAYASDLMVASAMQRCTTNEECTLVTNSCADNCGFVPVNKLNLTTLQGVYQQRCGKPMEANPQCNLNPPISAACINSRCTIDYAYSNNADPKDYQSGAYPVPESPVTSQVPPNAAPVNDRNGFTAYEMPQAGIHQNSLGTIYVPQSAPVSGGNYVPLGPVIAPAPQPAPKAPPVAKPAPAPIRAPAPAPVPVPYAPTAESNATPPTITQPAPPIAVPTPVPVAPAPTATDLTAPVAPPPAAIAVPAPTPVPTATTTPAAISTPSNPIPSSASDAIPEPRVPQEEPMLRGTSPDTGNLNAPIAPSEYKSQTFVPPPGSTIPVAPEDPGAKPPEGTVLLAPVPRGPDETPTFGTTTTEEEETPN